MPAGSAGPRWRWTRPPCSACVEESIAADGLVATWDDVARPVLAAVGERWATTGRGVEVEHLLSQCLVAVFGRVAGVRGCPAAPQPVAPGPARRDADRAARRAARRARRAAGRAGCRLPLARSRPARRRPRRRGAPDRARRRRALVPAARSTADLAVVTGLPVTRPRYRTFVAGPRLGRRGPAGGGRGARARSSTRASGSPAPCCGERRRRMSRTAPAADAVVQRVGARYRAGRPSEDRRAVGSPRWLTSTGAVSARLQAPDGGVPARPRVALGSLATPFEVLSPT